MDAICDQYKLHTLDVAHQALLKSALADPGSVDLEMVSNLIVDQSLRDSSFCKDAGRICYALVQAEAEQVHTSVFRRSLLNRLQQEFTNRDDTRKCSVSQWVCVVTFICNIFYYLKVNNAPIVALVNPVYDCLFTLAQPDALMNEEEVDCLVVQLHRIGEQLEMQERGRMDRLFCQLRDGFLLQEGLSSLTRLMLLEVLEFRAGGWVLSETTQRYYYSEVYD
ncbi:MIF4G domain-containing protein A [Denticeps clupeoides]|uniref:MIF4G domain-containing protein n=1 Tax=Denticeps clupeoides TaxID=299321 RepID=A0AAY4CPI2_9TELE|nr:MIF4G domain-containing protein [Denticeps clupeoides]